jgi:hypothetical protein
MDPITSPEVLLNKKIDKASHLATLTNRFLTTLNNIKKWNQLDHLVGEDRLKHHVSNIIEYTFYFRQKLITEQEIETLVKFLQEGKNPK